MAWKGDSPNRTRGRRWMKIRARILDRDPLCVICKAQGRTVPSKICDHKISLANGGTDADDNLQGLCKPCSDAKTEAERRAALGLKVKQPVGVDGWPI
jgi:5-methylcytosine-specific restriction protein A